MIIIIFFPKELFLKHFKEYHWWATGGQVYCKYDWVNMVSQIHELREIVFKNMEIEQAFLLSTPPTLNIWSSCDKILFSKLKTKHGLIALNKLSICYFIADHFQK